MRWRPLFAEVVTVSPIDRARTVQDSAGAEPARRIVRKTTISFRAEVDEFGGEGRMATIGGATMTGNGEIRAERRALEALAWEPKDGDHIIAVRDARVGGRTRTVSWWVTSWRLLAKEPGEAKMIAISFSTSPAARQQEG